ncbi:MAG TPA: DUF2946 family protein [Burkholderiales bacterium]
MRIVRFPRRVAAWIALASIAFNALWPVIANARPSAPALPSEICSATGLKHTGGGTGDAPDNGLRTTHCTLCHFNPERNTAIPCAGHLLLLPVAAISQPAAHFEALRPRAAIHPSAPPRAPPVLS